DGRSDALRGREDGGRATPRRKPRIARDASALVETSPAPRIPRPASSALLLLQVFQKLPQHALGEAPHGIVAVAEGGDLAFAISAYGDHCRAPGGALTQRGEGHPECFGHLSALH